MLTVTLAWLSAEMFGWFAVHEPVGYAVIAIVAVRVLWGFVGSRYARFEQFVQRPSVTWRYALTVVRGKAPRYVGHNPLGGWMIMALLSSITLTCITGWLFTTDRFWGDPWVHLLHNLFAWTVLVLIALHVMGVAQASRAHRENLVGAMITGRKPAPAGDDCA
jgi:cytochrome b